MGCDMHQYWEVKLPGEDEWTFYGHPRSERWYDLFAKIAGVRDYGRVKDCWEPKGLPDDLSKVTRQHLEYWGDCGYHTPTWIGMKEVKELDEWYRIRNEPFMGIEWEYFHMYVPDEIDVDDFRIVIWFDN